jgi:hypothetical protein
LKNDFTVKRVEMDAERIPDDVKVLFVLHPRGITDHAQYAIDQFVLRGGKLIAFLDPLPVVDSREQNPMLGNIPNAGSAPFLYFTYRDEGKSFQDIGLWTTDTASLTGLAEPEEIRTLDTTPGVLPILGVQPLLGRTFLESEGKEGQPLTAILTYGYWRSKFGSDPSLVGRTITLDGRAREVIGVVPESFRFLDTHPAVVLPIQFDRSKIYLGRFSFSSVARLKPGVTVAQANADVARMIPMAIGRFPPFPGFSAKMFEDARLGPLVQPLKQSLVGDLNAVLWVLMGTVGIVLLIACANVANLLLVRAEGRQHEMAIRSALGAGWDRIARDLLIESLTLGAAGGVLALALAYGALAVLKSLAPANLPRVDEISIGGPEADMAKFVAANRGGMATDRDGAPVFLAKSNWELGYVAEKFPKIAFAKTRERHDVNAER